MLKPIITWVLLYEIKASWKEAIESLQKALSIKPDYAEAYNNMGVEISRQVILKGQIKQNTISY